MKLLLSKSLKNKLRSDKNTLLKYVNDNRKYYGKEEPYTSVEFLNTMISDINNKYGINIEQINSLDDIQTIDEYNTEFDQHLLNRARSTYTGYIVNGKDHWGDIVIANADKITGNTFIDQQLFPFLMTQLNITPDYFALNYKRIIYSVLPIPDPKSESKKDPTKSQKDSDSTTTDTILKCFKTLHYDILPIGGDTKYIEGLEPYTKPEDIMTDYQKGQTDNNKSSKLAYDQDTNTYTLSIRGKTGSTAYYYELILLTSYALSRPTLELHVDNLTSNLNDSVRYFNSFTPTIPFKDSLPESSLPEKDGDNEIHYGAPGTGKSYTVDHLYPNAKRVTFYPTLDYTDFIGGLKPVRVDGQIDYQFVPGPLVDAIITALEQPEDDTQLIIEEINRAEAASVFGDTFQLLDRDESTHISRYSINNFQVAKYIDEHTTLNYNFVDNGIKLPGNLSLIATMNPADQGVFVLDSAFKRRWQMHYYPIKWTDDAENPLDIGKETATGFGMHWRDLAERINKMLLNLGINEDALLGQYFFTKKELHNKDLVGDKLLSYLWNDVARYKRNALFNYDTYSDLINAFAKQQKIFNQEAWDAAND
ncbi:AAA family ATPase [Lactobacillus amylovorus]|uniref:AAA family ATPase n=1 Tax=Lactobacillus amylovorus TaxID=1604 RepID=UPI0021C93121|nr:AAA family ATPase [Lactobacillus amylovorus]UXN12918.1 AAA family ATPase [Lactobacillus amylovorus]